LLADDSQKNNVMFHPNSPFRARWDILIVIVIIYQASSAGSQRWQALYRQGGWVCCHGM
jgi:hypothetical protein